MNDILLSVIIPVYNMELYIEDCLYSILNQDMKNSYEVIIINDGSTDRSKELIEKVINTKVNNNIIFKNIDNQGVSNARNFGISLSSGRFVSFLDGDDWLTSNYIKTTCECLINNGDYDIIYFDRYFSYPQGNKLVSYPLFNGNILENEKIFNELNYSACNKAFSQRLFDKGLSFQKGKIYEDMPFSLDALLLSDNIIKIEQPLYFVRQDTPNSVTNRLNDRELDLYYHLVSGLDKISNNSDSIKIEYMKYMDRTLLYWVVKLIRYQSVDILKNDKITLFLNENNVSSKFEKIFCVLINHKKFRVLSAIIKINDWMKELNK